MKQGEWSHGIIECTEQQPQGAGKHESEQNVALF